MKQFTILKEIYNIFIYIMGGSSSNLKNGIVYEIDDTIVKDGDKNYIQLDLGNVNKQNGINSCALMKHKGEITKYSGGENLVDLTGLGVDGDNMCNKLDDENYFSTCFLTPKKLSVKGVDDPEKCKIVYKAELKCDSGDTVESFINKQDNNNICIIIAIILLIVFLYL